MPYGDGTGPQGMGSMTGRGAGYCAGASQPGFASSFFRRGWTGFNRYFGRAVGRGRGRGLARSRFNRFMPFSRW